MEKMPRYLDLPVPPEGPRLGDKVRDLGITWGKLIVHANWKGKSIWAGMIDETLDRFLKKAQEFFEWLDSDRPARRERLTTVLRGLDPSGRPLPPPIEELHVEQWFQCHDYFIRVAHHAIAPTNDEYESWLGALERFLLDRLYPRTFDDLDAIDRIIEEGEGDAQA